MARARVAIIGAGAAGIVALRSLLKPPSNYEVRIFEKTNRVGGIWNYDNLGGPMYRNLKTNLPVTVMGFQDFPLEKAADASSFPTHYEVLDYIKNYLEHIDGRKYIQFNTEVTSVAPVAGEENEATRWLVAVSNKDGNLEEEFDFVIVCNGHYEVPNIPSIPGIDDFQGQVMHSRDYYEPEGFSGKKLLLLGARASGQDIAIDLSTHAAHVYLSHGNPRMLSKLPSNVSETAAVVAYENGAFVCSDGTAINDVDVFMFCTGYCYDFPFLDPRCGVTVESNRCLPLWKHLVNIEHPSMFFIGLCQAVSPIPQFTMQCALVRAIMDGRSTLPSKEEMLDDAAATYQRKVVSQGLKPRYLHNMSTEQWAYNDELAELAGCPKLPCVVGAMYLTNTKNRTHELLTYRDYVFEVLSEEEFRVSSRR